jgi:hypothetical protein
VPREELACAGDPLPPGALTDQPGPVHETPDPHVGARPRLEPFRVELRGVLRGPGEPAGGGSGQCDRSVSGRGSRDAVPGGAQQLRDLRDRRRHPRRHRCSRDRHTSGHGHPQRARLGDPAQVGPLGEHGEQQGRVGGGRRECTVPVEPAEQPGVGRGDNARTRHDAEHPTDRGGTPDRAESVRAVGERHHAGRHRRRAPPGRSTGHVLRRRRVAGDPLRRVGRRPGAQLGHPAQPDDHSARRAQPGHDLAVGARHLPGPRARSPLRVLAGDRHDVLDGDRYAGEREIREVGPRADRSGLGQCLLRTYPPERPDRVVTGRDPFQRLLGDPHRVQRSRPHSPGHLIRRTDHE